MNASRRGKSVLWSIEITSVVSSRCRKGLVVRDEQVRLVKRFTGGSKAIEQKSCTERELLLRINPTIPSDLT